MKKSLLFFLFLYLFSCIRGQHSPFFYQKPYAPNEITSDEHAKFIKRVCFKPDEADREKSNVLKENDNGQFVEFKPFGQIEQHLYLEHSLKYYYDKYLKDPSKKKEDWDYIKIKKEQEEKNKQYIQGWMVLVFKVNGVEIASHIYMRDEHQLESTHIDCGNIWFRPSWLKKGSNNVYEAQAQKTNRFPVMLYLRDIAKPGKYKIEVEVYPGKIECKKGSERSDEIICKGEFTLTVNADEAKEIAGCGGPKKIPPDIIFFTIAQGTFEYK